jgi:signal transduction histidine kinase
MRDPSVNDAAPACRALWWVADSASLPELWCKWLAIWGWEYTSTSSPEALQGIFIRQPPDMLLYLDEEIPPLDIIALPFGNTGQDSLAQRPLFIQITSNPPPDTRPDYHADLVLPVSPQTMDIQAFKTVLNLRAEAKALRARLQNDAETTIGIERLKNAIVRNVAHELRTPLLQIKSAITLLRDDRQDQFDRLIDLAQVATSRLELSVANITLLNKLINDSLNPPEFAPFQPGEAAESAIRHVRRMWQHREALQQIALEIGPNLPPVMGDRHLITIALQQLLDNALKFGEQRPIVLRVRQTEEMIFFQICDQGIGIESNQHDLIFDWFYQVDGSSTRSYGGIGAGLAIVRFILERHGVTIELESAVGKGSCFGFRLPLAGAG